MALIDYNGGQLHYDVNGSGTALLFMHGLGADRQQSQDFLKQLAGFQIITLDMPGHGDSPLSGGMSLEEQVGFDAYAEAAAYLIESLGVASVIVGGISMGAGVALHLALSGRVDVQALLLVRPAWLDRPARPQLDIISDIGAWLAEGDQIYAEAKLKQDPLYIMNMTGNPKCATSIMGAIWRPQARQASAVYSVMVEDKPLSSMDNLRRCNVPSLVIGNDFDPLHPAVIAEEIAEAMACANYVRLPSKYQEPQAHQERAIAEIERFLSDAA